MLREINFPFDCIHRAFGGPQPPSDFLKLFCERNKLVLASAFSDTCEFLLKAAMNDRKMNPFNNAKCLHEYFLTCPLEVKIRRHI